LICHVILHLKIATPRPRGKAPSLCRACLHLIIQALGSYAQGGAYLCQGIYPLSNLTSHALTVIHYALRWCENTSYNTVAPITGKRQCGIPPEGVLYPRISMELVKVESSRDIPKEWKEPLVQEGGERK